MNQTLIRPVIENRADTIQGQNDPKKNFPIKSNNKPLTSYLVGDMMAHRKNSLNLTDTKRRKKKLNEHTLISIQESCPWT